MSFSPSATTSNSNFIYDYKDSKNASADNNNTQHHQRCSSLPGSLQACVGSFLNNRPMTPTPPSRPSDSSNKPRTDTDISPIASEPDNQTTIPVQLEYNKVSKTGDESEKLPNTESTPNNNVKKNQTLQDLLLQFQKNSLLPKLVKRKRTDSEQPITQIPVSSIITPDNCKNAFFFLTISSVLILSLL